MAGSVLVGKMDGPDGEVRFEQPPEHGDDAVGHRFVDHHPPFVHVAVKAPVAEREKSQGT